MKGIGWLLLVLGVTAACGGGSNGGDGETVLEFLGFDQDMTLNYEVDVGLALPQAGQVKVAGVDPGYVDGVDAYRVEMRQNGNLIATRWYQVDDAGLFLLGEQVVEGSGVVERRYLTPVKLLPYPFTNDAGVAVQNWSTTSDVEQGGSETHRFDNQGQGNVTVPAGDFSAYHLVHQRTVGVDGPTTALEEYFSPGHWYVKFEYSPESTWSLAPAGG
ncbi:MAG: hypothetical protein DRI34_14255 [Deltaproteobacteria bacterium]|nr:MAG: hypothetical protein DRI34_14255 [Deltaproteobacteria bacterium]